VGFQFFVLAHFLFFVVLEGFFYAVYIFIVSKVDGFSYVEPMTEPTMIGLTHHKGTFRKVKT